MLTECKICGYKLYKMAAEKSLLEEEEDGLEERVTLTNGMGGGTRDFVDGSWILAP